MCVIIGWVFLPHGEGVCISHAKGSSACSWWRWEGGINPLMRTLGRLMLELEGVRNDKTLIGSLSHRRTHPCHATDWSVCSPTCLLPNLSSWLISNPADTRDRQTTHHCPFSSLWYTFCCPVSPMRINFSLPNREKKGKNIGSVRRTGDPGEKKWTRIAPGRGRGVFKRDNSLLCTSGKNVPCWHQSCVFYSWSDMEILMDKYSGHYLSRQLYLADHLLCYVANAAFCIV